MLPHGIARCYRPGDEGCHAKEDAESTRRKYPDDETHSGSSRGHHADNGADHTPHHGDDEGDHLAARRRLRVV
jgi:hypothetical protein